MSTADYPALVAGFGSGKTQAAVLRSIIGKLKYPMCNRGFYEPTYDLIRMIAFPRFEEMLTEMGLSYRLFKSPLNYIEIAGAGRVYFRSMDTPHRIIGYEHSDADVDELDTLKKDDAAKVWRQIIARNRQKKPDGNPNTIGVTTTPEGFRFVYETWKKNPAEGYSLIHAATYSNPHLPAGYIDSLKKIYPAHLLDAYMEGLFVNLRSGTIYRSYNRSACRSTEAIRPKENLYIGMDFNVTNMAATIYVRRQREWHAVAELVGIYDTPDIIRVIKERWKDKGHNIFVYPDASGVSRKTNDASISDIALLRHAGFEVRVRAKNPPVKDRIISVNSAFDRKLLFINDTTCPTVADCLEQQVYDSNGEPDKAGGKDHTNDASGYPVAFEMPVSGIFAGCDLG